MIKILHIKFKLYSQIVSFVPIILCKGRQLWISNHNHGFLWVVITHPFSDFNGSLAKPLLKLGQRTNNRVSSDFRRYDTHLALNSIGRRCESNPPDTWRNDDVFITSKRCRRRRLDVMKMLLLQPTPLCECNCHNANAGLVIPFR